MENKRWQLNAEQRASIKRAFIKYVAPLLLAFLTALQLGKPLQEAVIWVYAAALTMSINILTKLISETK